MAVADTSFLIDVLAGEAPALEKLRELISRGEPLWLPAPALHELHFGAALSRDPARERSRIDELERAVPVAAFDGAAAKAAGGIEAGLLRAGKRPGRVDVQILAQASLRAERIVTRDRRFPKIPGVEVESY